MSLEEDVSEDDSPSTGASEDSIDIQVKPITSFPKKITSRYRSNEGSSLLPLDFSVSTPNAKKSSGVLNLVGDQVVFHRSPSSSPPTKSPVVETQVFRLKNYEVEEFRRGVKRPIEDQWSPSKAIKREENELNDSSDIVSAEPPHSPLLRPSPLFNHLVAPQFLIPPTWSHLSRFPYPHLMNGFLRHPFLRPPGFLPHAPYLIPPVFQSGIPFIPTPPPRLPSPVPTRLIEAVSSNINQIPSSVSPAESPILGSDKQQNQVKGGREADSSKRKFFSVESLLSPTQEKSEPVSSNRGVQNSPLPPPPPLRLPLRKQQEELLSKPHSITTTSQHCLPPPPRLPRSSATSPDQLCPAQSYASSSSPKNKQRNYKNMTRERRIEANARERTRVHTISAAFDTLRQTIPAFSHNQKLSKLSVLRIAASYILTLSRLAGEDYSESSTAPSLEECVDLTTKTIQVEGKAKKKKDD